MKNIHLPGPGTNFQVIASIALRQVVLWAIFLSGLFYLTACQGLLSTPVPQTEAMSLFEDDFSDPSRQWWVSPAENGFAGHDDGVFRMMVNSSSSDIWAQPGLNLVDVRVEVNAIKVGGERNNRFGILCRVQESSRYYVFLVSSDGYHGIGKVAPGEYQLLGDQALLPSDKIPQGSTYLNLRADCVGDRLTLYVNGQKIQEVRDAEFKSGDVGLITGSYGGRTEILFDYFRVIQP